MKKNIHGPSINKHKCLNWKSMIQLDFFTLQDIYKLICCSAGKMSNRSVPLINSEPSHFSSWILMLSHVLAIGSTAWTEIIFCLLMMLIIQNMISFCFVDQKGNIHSVPNLRGFWDYRGSFTNTKIPHLCIHKPKVVVVWSAVVKTVKAGDPV